MRGYLVDRGFNLENLVTKFPDVEHSLDKELSEIATALYEECGVTASVSTIWCSLHQQGFMCKKVHTSSTLVYNNHN